MGAHVRKWYGGTAGDGPRRPSVSTETMVAAAMAIAGLLAGLRLPWQNPAERRAGISRVGMADHAGCRCTLL